MSRPRLRLGFLACLLVLGVCGGTLPAQESRTGIWGLVLRCGDPAVSRTSLLKDFADYVEAYPAGAHTPMATDLFRELARMVPEDGKRFAESRPFAELTTEQQIDDLIFQLRDQNGRQMMQPGSVSALVGDPRSPEDPASRLVAFGYEAVPKLIEAITDTRLTRTVGFWRDFVFSHRVQRVGDAAVDIIEALALDRWKAQRIPNVPMCDDGAQFGVQREIRKWWATVDTAGEIEALRVAIGPGDGKDSLRAFSDFARKYPREATSTFLDLSDRQPDQPIVDHVLRFPDDLHHYGLLRFLPAEVAAPHSARRQLVATEVLFRAGKMESLPAFLARWKAIDVATTDEVTLLRWIRCLLSTRKPDCVRLARNALARSSASVRRGAISEIYGFERRDAIRALFLKGSLAPDDAAGHDALESLLAEMLEDARRTGRPFEKLEDPRVCDVAAFWLGGWNQEYREAAATRPTTPDGRLAAVKDVATRRGVR